MTATSDIDDRETTHTEPWCDTKLHTLPVPPGVEDPGCHRIIQAGSLYALITRHHTGVVVAALGRNVVPIETFREYVAQAGTQLAYIPLQRTA
ncbi:hypothetical protein [Kineosporia succinea]|uniref:Uncharacterized protein n=1 Tax=Kineosporia succinea TaxID=84632 RepID=A0ABT9P9K7_9ACTN|nr:hypothetical protein [Kineosporia succinea]MDP9829373.1 hypothetical protein [Kineosporia succinea]